MTDDERQLLSLLKERCYREGDFTLSSGEKSTIYFDAKNLFLSSVGASLIGNIIFERTKDLGIEAIGGLEVGAIPLTTAAVFAYHQHGKTIDGFFVRNKAKEHGTKKIVEGHLRPGCKVAVVDDVATTGESIMKAIEAVKKTECTPVLVLVLVDRQSGAAELFQKNGIPYKAIFSIGDFRPAAVR